jgi:hypothetical protein
MGTADAEAVWRIGSARIVAATRFTGDFGVDLLRVQVVSERSFASSPVQVRLALPPFLHPLGAQVVRRSRACQMNVSRLPVAQERTPFR